NHVESAGAVARAGIHVLVEKPLALDSAGCASIAAACADAGVVGAVAHVERFHTAIRNLRDATVSGGLGVIEQVKTIRLSSPSRRHDGGGVLLDLGIHDFDVIAWMTERSIDIPSIRAHLLDGPWSTSARVTTELTDGTATETSVSYSLGRRSRICVVKGSTGTRTADTSVLDPREPDPLTMQLEAFCDNIVGRRRHGDLASLRDGGSRRQCGYGGVQAGRRGVRITADRRPRLIRPPNPGCRRTTGAEPSAAFQDS
ncbi:MAG: Gfo/Idh/MocA family oxidoreductase, partial [Candidatus Nanopelagicales bacterium]